MVIFTLLMRQRDRIGTMNQVDWDLCLRCSACVVGHLITELKVIAFFQLGGSLIQREGSELDEIRQE